MTLCVSTVSILTARYVMSPNVLRLQLDDDDLVDFLYDLRFSIMEAYTGIVQGFASCEGCGTTARRCARPFMPRPLSFFLDVCRTMAV